MTLAELLRRHRELAGALEAPASEESPIERGQAPLSMPREERPPTGTLAPPEYGDPRLPMPETPAEERATREVPQRREDLPLPPEPSLRDASQWREALPLPSELSFPEPESEPARDVPNPELDSRRVIWSARRLSQEMEEV